MIRAVFSPQAAIDLEDIGDYIAGDNWRRALSFVADIEAKCRGLGQAPGIGTVRPELGEGVRMLPHGLYLIFYREHGTTLRIERVLHGARDIGGADFNPGD